MKWLPSILVVIALFVLIKMASLRPESPSGSDAAHAAEPAPARHPGPAEPSAAGTPAAPQNSPAATAEAVPGAASAAQAAPATPPARDVKPGTISGTVVNAEQAVVPGVRVHLEDGGMHTSTTTDGYGRFEFTGLSQGSFTLRAEDPDSLYTVSHRERVTLAQGGTTEATVQMGRGRGTIQGEVVDQNGAPLAAAQVVMNSDTMALPPVLTDSKGRFRIGGIPDGSWQVAITGFETWPHAIREVRLERGQARGADGEDAILTIQVPVLLQRLSLHLVGSLLHTHRFTGDESVTLRPLFQLEDPALAELAAPRVARVDEEGIVEFQNLWPGRYELRARDASGKSLLEDASGPVELVLKEGPGLVQSVALRKATLGAGVEIPGWVYFLVFVVFALFLFLALVVFPMPLAPRAPRGLPAPEAASPAPAPAATDGGAG